MSRLLAVLLIAALAAVGGAWADHQEPQKRLTKADNARARAMLLRQADLPGFRPQPAAGENAHVDCAPSVSESDLTLTGEAEGPPFGAGLAAVSSAARLYRTTTEADTSWRRGTSAAGVRCASAVVRRTYGRQGIRLVSLRRVPFPGVAARTVAYRIQLSARTPQGTVTLFIDLVALQRGRAHATVLFGTPLVPADRAVELRLARLVAGRMAGALSR